ncbi:hypothetical protein RR46_01818 [Papilio xuthus]|uniref:DUF4780 domain-containing protein n=1 Tax=Papilio xuthus TaxID=66420 RepID=A0A194QIX3_PAPXU|nr:hypothetical protein RR46_01818 [Papilio xuthus]
MMLTIFGLPQKITYNNLKKIIHKECYISQFLLDDFLQDLDGKKKIKICVADDIEANLVKKGLDGYKMDKNILSVVPVAPKIDTVEQSRVNTKDTVIPCIEKIDNQVTNSFKAVLKVKNFATENKPKKKKTKKRKKNKKKRLQLAKQATMMDSIKTETPLLLGDLIVQHPVKIEKDLISDPVQIKPTVSQPASTNQIKEDTPSIRSVPLKQTIKRKKELNKSDELEIDMTEKKRFKFDASAIESTKEESCVCVVITCGLTGHLSKDVADFVLDSIRNKLIEDSKIETIHIPVFTKNPIYIDGTVKLFCEDENAFDWLEPVVVNPDLMGGSVYVKFIGQANRLAKS